MDQNLVILDDAPVYNAFHMLGMFSLFNGSAVKGIELTKGGFPARYGGRLSSVLEVVMVEGSLRQWKGEAGVGLISSHGMVQGPIVKDKASFIVTGRRTYLDLLLYPLYRQLDPRPSFFFYDATAKLHWQVTPKDRLYLSGYMGRDGFGAKSQPKDEHSTLANVGLRWGNVLGSLRWNREMGSSLFSNMVLSYAHYDYSVRRDRHGQGTRGGTRFVASIRNVGLKYELQWDAHWNHRVRMGLSSLGYQFAPQAFTSESGGETVRKGAAQYIYSVESAAYVEDEWQLWSWGRANLGARMIYYGTKGYSRWALEPRASLSVYLTDQMSLKGGFALMHQHMHQLSSFGLGLPTDIWVPATRVLPSQQGWIVSAGITHDLPWIGSSVSVEGYYKRSRGNLAYGEQTDRFFQSISGQLPARFWESVALSGRAWSAGMEVFFQRRVGQLSGWLGYTLSWARQQYDGLNGGCEFWARYDRRHDVSVVGMYEFNPRWRVSATWVYSTGAAVTLPSALYAHTPVWENEIWGYNYEYVGINTARMPAYHRLDLGMQYVWRSPRFEHVLSVDVYNAYCRFNALYYEMDVDQQFNSDDTTDERERLMRVTLFPILPSVAYKISF